jgi:putative DNA primase/helicase
VSTDGAKREATPGDLFTMSAAVRPEPGEPVEFLKFLDWMTCGITALRDWILTALGIALFGHVTCKIINFYGHGSNGKGTLLRTLYSVAGGYSTTIPRSLVIKEPGTGSRFDKANLPGKRVAILFDLKADRGKLNLDELKSIAGDGDVVPIEKKNKDSYNERLKCKIFIASNEKIPIDSHGDSEKKRFCLIPFNAHITNKDPELEDRFVPEYGKILNLFLTYATKYYANGRKMLPCKEIDAATADYFDSQDLIGRFISDECTLDPAAIVRKTEIYEKFASYCQGEHGIKNPINSKKFADALEKREIIEGVRRVNGKNTRVFIGIITGTATLLQRNANSDLLSIETSRVESNSNLENSCSSVADGAKIQPSNGDNSGADGEVPGTAASYSNPEQRALWNNPEAILY